MALLLSMVLNGYNAWGAWRVLWKTVFLQLVVCPPVHSFLNREAWYIPWVAGCLMLSGLSTRICWLGMGSDIIVALLSSGVKTRVVANGKGEGRAFENQRRGDPFKNKLCDLVAFGEDDVVGRMVK